MNMLLQIFSWAFMGLWIVCLVLYGVRYVQMVKAYNALTKSLLPLEERIARLEEAIRL